MNFYNFNLIYLFIYLFILGESWQNIMLDCSSRPDEVKCDNKSDDAGSASGCGNDIAFPYFISFYVLCSFLVCILILFII